MTRADQFIKELNYNNLRTSVTPIARAEFDDAYLFFFSDLSVASLEKHGTERFAAHIDDVIDCVESEKAIQTFKALKKQLQDRP